MKNSESLFEYNSEDVRAGRVESPAGSRPAPTKLSPAARKTIYSVCVAAVAVILSLALIFTVINRVNDGLVMELQVGDITPYTVADGQYTGAYASNRMAAAVTVTIESGLVIDIALDGFTRIDTARAQRVFDAVIESQSLVTYDEEVGTQPTDIILLMAIGRAVNGDSGETMI